ncbi:spore coat protein U domain-containing protein [uncultured Hydrogenophaga sp.]|uniref:spore coat protein U domain-containing protein n=1 Tax=uncultured Hydrogenophaga sp. TaxID=199683 RepID=UPI00265DAF3E|nr:spore coat protein U domain-containing protein [uncultured Hydrogenophaga sp.]
MRPCERTTSLGRSAAIFLLTLCSNAHAAYSCNMTVQRVNLIAQTLSTTAVVRMLTLNCSRAPSDASSMTYRIAADNGDNASGQTRRVRRGTNNNYLSYRLNRGGSMGQTAPCTTAGTIWRNNGAGLITGTMNFGSSLNASHTWSYCAVANPSLALPAGEYTDQVELTLRYPNTGQGQLLAVPLDLQFGVQTLCLIDKPIANLSVSYTSRQTAAATASTQVLLRCNVNTPWTVGLLGPGAPAAAPVANLTNQSLLGLTYSLQVTPTSGTGLGNTGTGAPGNDGQQPVTIQLHVPGGQAGICNVAVCNGAATHTLVVTY